MLTIGTYYGDPADNIISLPEAGKGCHPGRLHRRGDFELALKVEWEFAQRRSRERTFQKEGVAST